MKIHSLHYYPLKSACGVSTNQLEIHSKGLLFDRHWMIIDEKGHFISLRNESRLIYLQTHLVGNQINLSAPDLEDISFNDAYMGDLFPIKLWKDPLLVGEISPEVSAWMSRFLERSCKVVTLAKDCKRAVDPMYAQGKSVDLADGYPFLFTFEESLSELNQKLKAPVLMNRFRPNIVLSGGDRFSETTIKKLQIGSIIFDLVKPCSRCIVVNTDPDTGKKGVEPLKTLSTYRNVNGKILFGMNAVHTGEGIITLESPVKVLEIFT